MNRARSSPVPKEEFIVSSAGFEVCRDKTGDGMAKGIEVTRESGVGSPVEVTMGRTGCCDQEVLDVALRISFPSNVPLSLFNAISPAHPSGVCKKTGVF